jgi:hypothetical protein
MNIAGAQVQTGRVVAAIASYKKVLASGALSDDQRAAAEQALGAAEAKLAHVRVDVVAPTASDEVVLDDQRVVLGSELPVDPGTHRLRLVRPGAEPHEETFSISAGERRELHLTGSEPKPSRSLPTAALVVASVSVVTLGTSAFLGLSGLSDLSDLRKGCGAGGTCAPDDVDAARGKIVASDITLVVGLVTAAVAGYLFIAHGRRADPARRSASPLMVRW